MFQLRLLTCQCKAAKWLLLSLALTTPTGLSAFSRVEQQWVEMVSEFYGPRAGQRVTSWRGLMADLNDEPAMVQLSEINDFFNQINFIDDFKLWGKKDYWATPLEFLGSNAGDCEDFTIAKYYSLRELGIEENKLRLIYVKAIELDQFHMVLAYYSTPSAEPLILDNLDPVVRRASTREDLQPIFSFNAKNLWLIKAQKSRMAGDASRLNLWNDLQARQKADSLNRPIIDVDE
ncbi:transglutaminase-like cysteine peptidase [Vibrio sp. WXL210]|uniref:transglutaminase-like cysteine peptidase n=1 Tax=Vibrio sp. WXL210 TaxID=3450709 RepID=UPI003EC899D8